MEDCKILELVSENDEKDIKKKIKNGFNNTIKWCKENKEIIAISIPVIIFGIKTFDKNLNLRRAARLRDSSIYDRSMGMYLESTKPLTTAQKLDIDAMHKAGMSYSEIAQKLHIKWK